MTVNSPRPSGQTEDNVQDLDQFLKQIHMRMDMYEQFVARRFDELSTEINATSQIAEMAEETIAARFAEVLEIIGAIARSGEGNAPMNAGVELEKVIEVTEGAANKIMDASDRIMDKLSAEHDLNDPETREKVLEDVKQEVQEILLACSFQDLTGQRVRKTLENMQLIEERLSTTLERLGIEIETKEASLPPENSKADVASQEDIDSLFD